MVTKDQYQGAQLEQANNAYQTANPGATNPVQPQQAPTVSTYKAPSTWDNVRFGAKYLAAKGLEGVTDIGEGIGHLGKIVSDLGPTDGDNMRRKNVADEQYNNQKDAIEKFSTLGMNKDVLANGTDSKILNVTGDLLKIAPAIAGAEPTGGATFYLQGVGAAAKQVDAMKANGVKFDNHSDELYIQGAGIINYLLGKSVSSTILGKMGAGFTNDVVGSLSADATKELADLGANATTEDVANVYATKALNFSQRLQQYGLGVLKSYPKIGTEFAGANLASSGLKAGVNKLSVNNPLGDVTGDEIVKDISSPFYNNDTPANGNLGQYFANLVTSPAAGLSVLHGATTAGMLFDKSPLKNSVIESLQKDGSPQNVQTVKDQMSRMGQEKGWTDDEISNTNTTVDALADITSKIPSDLAPGKFYDATNLILGRRQLEAVLDQVKQRKVNLDPAIADKAAPFEAMLNAKIEQANDKLDEIVTDKKFTYSDEGGKYYKTKDGEKAVEISKERFDLEGLENKAKPKYQQSKVITEPETSSRSATEKPAAEPKPEPAKKAPVTDSSMLDDLDNELDTFKQSQEEPNNAVQEQSAGEVGVRNAPTMGEEVGKADQSEKPAGQSEETQKPEKTQQLRSVTEGNGLVDHSDEIFDKVLKNLATAKGSAGKASVIHLQTLTLREEAELGKTNPEYEKLWQADNDGTLDEAGQDRLHQIYKSATLKKQIQTLKSTYEKAKQDGTNPDLVQKIDEALKTQTSPVDDYDTNVVKKTFFEKVAKKSNPDLDLNKVREESLNIAKDRGADKPSFGDFEKAVDRVNDQNDNIPAKQTPSVPTEKSESAKPEAVTTPANAESAYTSEKLPVRGSDVSYNKKNWKVGSILKADKELKYKLIDDQGKELWINSPMFLGDNPKAKVGKDIFNEPEPTEKPYHVYLQGEGHKETPGNNFPNKHGLDLFSHNLEDIGGKGFGISEGSTGLSIAKGSTAAEAAKNAHEVLKTKTPAEMQELIKNQHDKGLKSPRGTIKPEVTDTENTEAVITKATATVRKAKATTRGSAESAGVIDDIDEAIDEIDKEIEKSAATPEYIKAREEAIAEENFINTPDGEPAKEEPKQDEKANKRKKFEDELKAAKKAFMDTFNKALSGINPETLEKGIKLIAVYAKIGIHDFKEIATDLAADLGDKLRDIFESLKASYGAYASQEATDDELDNMTNLREVRKAKIEDFLKNTQNDTGRESDTLDKNSPELDEGESTGRTAGNVEKRPAKELHGSEDDGSGKAGSAVEKQQNEPGRSGQSGSGDNLSTGKPGTVGRPAEPGNGPATEPNAPKRTIAPADQNHVIKPDDTIVPPGAVGKFNANVDALFLLKKLEAEDRNPTAEEKKMLAQFVGWGGLAKYLDTPVRPDNDAVNALLNGKRTQFYDTKYNRITLDFTDRGPLDLQKYSSFNALLDDTRKILVNSGYAISPDALRAPLLKALLSNEEYQDAQNSTINAHYTERQVINNMWDITDKLGFKGGRVLESSAGIGHFFGLMPKELQGKTSLQAYELDSITGRILKKLYPQANTTVTGFENSRVPQNSVDLAIGNVPFAANAPYDKNFPDLSKFSMHNYFIAKNLKLLKPGGLAVMITSSSTMDNPASAKFREWVTAPDGGNSYLVGAMRFPNNAFSENAGTQVTTDMLVFQKKGQVVNSELEQPFRYTKFLKTGKDADGNTVDLHVNEYYHDHPEQMLGEMMTAHEAGSGGLYGSDNATLKAPDNFNLDKELKKANEVFPKDIAGNKTHPEKIQEQPITAIDQKEGSMYAKPTGPVYIVRDGDGVPLKLEPKQEKLARDYIGIKSRLLQLISDEQLSDDADLNSPEKLRAELNTDYDAFIKKYGNINSRSTQFIADQDIDFPIVASLENIARSIETKEGKDRIVSTITKGDILQKRVNFPRKDPEKANDIKDAINISLNYRNGLDINYMAKMLGEDADAIRERLLKEELAYENPDTGILETPEEYLSGYVRDKLKKAEIASTTDPAYLKNVAQLKKVIPEDIPSALISYSLGSSWIPSHVYEEFTKDTFSANVAIKYLDKAGKFLVTKGYGFNNAAVQNTYAAGGMNGIELLDATLNNKQVIVTDTVVGADGTKRQVKNPEKTAAAQAMQVTLQEEFQNWIRNNEPVQHETERIYNDVFNGQILRSYRIPDFQHYPGASTTITLREHQKRAVSRNLVESTLDAHEVGSGKTYTIITTAMEMRRLGTARKPLIGVQNSTLGDFVADFKRLYPSAKILAPTSKEMEAEGRKRLFAKIATGDWDAIILPHSQVTMIPDDPERQKAYIMEQIQELRDTINTVDDYRERKKMESEVKQLVAEMDKLNPSGDGEGKKSAGKSVAKKMGEKSLKIKAGMEKVFDRKTDNILNFEQLGIDAMLMDEAHKYKRLGFQTSMQNIKGIDTSKSQRSQSILLKSRWVQEKTGGKNVSFFTGTPISNTMAEAWTMMKYLRPDILEHMGIQYFDQFAKTFGQVIPSLEQTGGGTFKVQNRFAKFQNLPEFITAFRAMTDVVLTSDVKEFQNTTTIPKLKNGKFTQVILPQSPELKRQIAEFKRTLEWFDNLSGRQKKENSHVPLVVYNKAKQASIDLRLLDPTNVDSPESKVNKAVENAYRIYKEKASNKGVQMIFSDMYQSPEPKNKYLDEDGYVVNPAYGKDRFNLFEDIKKKLVAKGVPADEIVIFTEPKYDRPERKKAVFVDANSGKIRFLLGTTEKMGVGVNAQQKLVALHHLDAPPRPMDFEQRNGRIIRQGNENKEVEVLTYGVEKTLDSSAFQRLSTKQKFINQIMKGENLERVTEDPADEAQMTFDEMMAHLSDSPFAMQKLMVDNKLRSEIMKQQNFEQKIKRSHRLLREEETELKRDKAKLKDEIVHAETVRTKFPDGNLTSLDIHGQEPITDKFGEGADIYVQKLIDKYFSSPTKYAKGGFELNSERVELEVLNKERSSKETGLVVDIPALYYTMPGVGLNGERWSSGGYEIPSNSGTGLISSIRSKLDSVLVRPSQTQNAINTAEKNIEVLQKDTKATFDSSKIKELETESEALKAKMLAESKKTPPDDDNHGGGQTTGEYVRDQSNIKGALDFLDKMKAKDDGRFLSSIVPIPPAVWNGAIDVMKNILKATNSTQKAIRVAGQYIIDRGGSEAQAKDFEATIADKMAKTSTGQKANLADTEEAINEDSLRKSVADLQTKMKDQELSPDEKSFARMDVSKLNRKELHRYVEVAAVLSVDPQGVLTKDVTDLMDRVGNRLNPKAGTAVPPEPPTNTPGGNDNLMGDDEHHRRIPKKEKLPMASTEELPQQTDSDGKPVAKENYSAIGKFKDIRVRNLEQLKQYGKDLGDFSALRDIRQYATSKSQASIIMKTATDRILKAVGKGGWDLLRQALVESRLRGIRERWENWSTQIKKASDNELDDLFAEGKQSMMYDVVSRLDGYEDDPKPEQTILGMLSNDQYDDAREYLSDMFANAADNVAFFDKLSNGKSFDEIVKDQKFVDPKMQEAFEAYKSLMAKPFEESHAANEGIFSDALGPLDTYYPLVPTGADKHFVVTPGNKYKAPENPNNKFATGQGNNYSTALADLSHRLSNAIRSSNKANAIKSLENAGLIAKINKDTPDDGYIKVNGEVYTAKKVMVQDSRLITNNGHTVSLPARYVLMPTWLYKEVKPIFEDTGNLHDDFSLFGRINNLGIKLMLGGPIEATSHSYRLLGGIVNSMPYMQEWAYKNGIIGHAGGLILNNPFVKTFSGMGHILFTDISSDEAMETIQEMAKMGVIPEKTWQKTWSKEFAELTGAKKVPLWDWSPILYGKNSLDLKSRVLLYRLTKAMNPDATTEQVVTMQNELGNYTIALQGELEKFVKRHGLAPFYSFGGAIYRSGIKSVFGLSNLPLTRPSMKEAFTTKMGAIQMSKLATYKMAQLISAGIVGLVGYWAFMYHAQTNRWPWQDKHSKLLKLNFPEQAKNSLTRKMFMDKKSGEYPDVDFSFFNPFINRGIRAIGAPKAYETHMLGGTVGQTIEAGSIQAINTNLSPYTSSPAIQLGVTALSGDAPYITGIRDKYTGTPGLGFFRKVNTFPAGAQIPANLAVGVAGMNPILDYALSPLTKALKYKYQAQDQDAYTAATSVFNTVMPHLLTPHGSDEFKEAGLKKQQKAINTSMTKEQAKLHNK